MPSPWLSVPLTEYEGHMGRAGVGQLEALSDLFAEALAYCRPDSVAILGIAGGNGLERVERQNVSRVVGLDANQSYLNAVRQRYSAITGLELYCVDLAGEVPKLPPVRLVHAALIFEHAGLGQCLGNALALVAPQGALSIVLQLAGDGAARIGPTPFPSIQALKPGFSLIDPERLGLTLAERGLHLAYQTRRPLPGGKAFWMGIFLRE